MSISSADYWTLCYGCIGRVRILSGTHIRGKSLDYWRSVSSSWRSSCFWRLFMHCLKLHDVHHSIHSFTTLTWRPFIHGHLIPKSTLQINAITSLHILDFARLQVMFSAVCTNCSVLSALLVKYWVYLLFVLMHELHQEGWLPSVVLG